MRSALRVGIVGAGSIVRSRHAPGLKKIPDVEIVAVANARAESARDFCEQWAPKAQVEENWQALVQREDVDIVWIGTGPFLHEPVTLAALAAGKHVFCQARMSTNLASARRMLEASRQRPDLVTMLCPPPVGLRMDAFVRDLLAHGRVGEVRLVRVCTQHGGFLDPSAPAHWRQRFDISGKNVLTLGIYAEVLGRWWGKVEPVYARGYLFVRERGGQKVQIPDAVEVLGSLGCGVGFSMALSGVYPGPPADFLEIIGSRATVRVDAITDAVSIAEPGSVDFSQLPMPAELDRPWQVEADFIEAVRNPSRPRPHPDFADGVAYMEVVEKVWDLMGGGLGF